MTKTVASIETAVDRRAAQTARMVALDKKLDSLHARLLTGGKAPDGGLQNWYTLNGQTVIVHEYPDNNGYEVYTPIVDTIAVDATFAALDRIANPQPRHCLNCDKTATAFCNAYHTTSTVNPAKPQATGSLLDKATEDVAERASAYFRDKRRTMHGPELVALHDAIEVREALLSVALNVREAQEDRNPQPTAADRGAARGVVNDPLWTAETDGDWSGAAVYPVTLSPDGVPV